MSCGIFPQNELSPINLTTVIIHFNNFEGEKMNKNQLDNEDKIDELFLNCRNAEISENYGQIIRICDEILKISPDNPIAIGYKSFAYIRLGEYEKASDLLDYGCRLYPENPYLISNRAMLHYEMGEYEKSLECCEEGLKIKKFDELCENKLKALIKLDRISEAIEFYRSLRCVYLEDLLIEAGKYREALEFCVEEDMTNCGEIIDWIKDCIKKDGLNVGDYLGDYYINWIYRIRHAYNVRVCPDCGGELIPIIWGFPGSDLVKKSAEGKVLLGGCVIGLNPNDYHCKQCDHEFVLGYKGLEIEKSELSRYVRFKIDELISHLKTSSCIVIKPLDDLKLELEGFDDEEFNAFISHLKEIGFIYEPEKGYVKLSGFEDMECIRSEVF